MDKKSVKLYRLFYLILMILILAELILFFQSGGKKSDHTDSSADPTVSSDLAAQFESALSNGRIEVWYQPIILSSNEQLAGAEALSRWKDGDSLISPGVFIPVLEESGKIPQLDRYVFQTVCRFQKERFETGKELFPISVNLSAKTCMQSSVVSEYDEIFTEYNLPDGAVSIEVTESSEMEKDRLSEVVREFQSAGFTVETDDFGSGFANYENLASIPYDVLKMDKSLIDGIGSERGNHVVHSIIAMAKELHMKTIAEGVETADQKEFLKSEGCDAVQGYFYSRPLSPKDFRTYLGSR